ncbi:SMI1/KNR4 family protein [Corallococcus sp. M34]|uniref:SMI1/KNR4 family protein n=1 Tax=Citreicoccus inhibens TaxID=2849499 RepID=UPI001C22E47B|nr:SMI1/KNR4 family protein [Citreicoccus inhibens]MBU8898940.1 SMI1/KNR4 family protein [Citreicoccus inhibens]
MDTLLAEVSRHHFPRPPATSAQLARFEARVGWELDPELRAFYLHCDGARLFESGPDANYRFLSLDEIRRARIAIVGSDDDSAGAASWFSIVDMQDSNFVVVDVARREGSSYPLFDAFHETFPEMERIASSFEEFLARALASDGYSYWLR